MHKSVKRAGWMFLGIIAAYILVMVIATYLYITSGFNFNEYGSIVVGQAIIIVPTLLFLVITRTKPSQYLAYRKISIGNICLIVLFAYCIMPLLAVVNMISMMFASSGTEAVTGLLDQIPLVPGLFVMAVLPAMCEEFAFRGIFYGSYRKNGILPAALMSALAFGLMHMNFNQFSYAFVLGLIMVLLIEATGSLWSTVIVHFVYNANSVVLTKLLSTAESYLPELGDSMDTAAELTSIQYGMALIVYLPLAAGGAVLAWLLYRAIAKNCGRYGHVQKMLKVRTGKKNFSIPFIIGAVLCLAYMVLIEF